MVDFRTHGQEVAVGVGQGDVDSGAVVMEPRSVEGVGDVNVQWGALDKVKHPALHGEGSCGVENDKVEVGTGTVETLLGGGYGIGQFGEEESFVQVGVEHLSGEVVGGGVDEVDKDGGIFFQNVDKPHFPKFGFGGSVGGVNGIDGRLCR